MALHPCCTIGRISSCKTYLPGAKLNFLHVFSHRSLDGKVKLGAVNCDEEKSLCGKYGIQGFPSIKFFGSNKEKPEDYEGGRDAASIVTYGEQAWAKNAKAPEVRPLLCPGHPACKVIVSTSKVSRPGLRMTRHLRCAPCSMGILHAKEWCLLVR